jgi:hypothetical protein
MKTLYVTRNSITDQPSDYSYEVSAPDNAKFGVSVSGQAVLYTPHGDFLGANTWDEGISWFEDRTEAMEFSKAHTWIKDHSEQNAHFYEIGAKVYIEITTSGDVIYHPSVQAWTVASLDRPESQFEVEL